MITYEQWIAVTHNLIFIFTFAAYWFLSLIIWFTTASLRKGRSSSGRIKSKSMLSSTNFWIMFGILIFILGISIYFTFFPIHLNLIG